MVVNFFLGANSGSGFQNLYEAFVSPENSRDIMVLKGGPGVGKSSFMKYLGKKAEERGENVEYIWCSGDPDSLDAVRLPRLGIIAVDGTSPHIIEPNLPAAVDRYVNLGCCYDVDRLKEKREEIEGHMKRYKAAYRQAYRALQAEQEVKQTLVELLQVGYDKVKLLKRAKGIIKRELGKLGTGKGSVTKRFFGGLTCQGELCRFDTVGALADRVYVINSSATLGEEMLAQILHAATERKYDCIVSPSPDDLSRCRHLIIPELRLAFLSEQEGTTYPDRPYRRIRLDPMLNQQNCRENRAKCRFYRRTAELLREEGLRALQAAKAHHDLLEQVYNPYVDFSKVYAMAEEEWQRIERML